jgi:hypothetical protein
MNVDDLQNKLIAAARQLTPSQAVPYGFERRMMARLRTLRTPDCWALWARALWRAAGPCVGLALVVAAWSFFSGSGNSVTSDFSQDFENTVLAAAAFDQTPTEAGR